MLCFYNLKGIFRERVHSEVTVTRRAQVRSSAGHISARRMPILLRQGTARSSEERGEQGSQEKEEKLKLQKPGKGNWKPR